MIAHMKCGILLLALCLVGCSSSNKVKHYQPTSCDIGKGCMNEVLIETAKRQCKEEACHSIEVDMSQLANIQYDTVYLLRKYQFDLSKSCGKLQLNKFQQHLFHEACDYMIFSQENSLTGYVRGSCFSAVNYMEKLENNIWFSNIDKSPIFNQVFQNKNPFVLYQDANVIGIKMKKNQSTEHAVSCFLPREYQAP